MCASLKLFPYVYIYVTIIKEYFKIVSIGLNGHKYKLFSTIFKNYADIHIDIFRKRWIWAIHFKSPMFLRHFFYFPNLISKFSSYVYEFKNMTLFVWVLFLSYFLEADHFLQISHTKLFFGRWGNLLFWNYSIFFIFIPIKMNQKRKYSTRIVFILGYDWIFLKLMNLLKNMIKYRSNKTSNINFR